MKYLFSIICFFYSVAVYSESCPSNDICDLEKSFIQLQSDIDEFINKKSIKDKDEFDRKESEFQERFDALSSRYFHPAGNQTWTNYSPVDFVMAKTDEMLKYSLPNKRSTIEYKAVTQRIKNQQLDILEADTKSLIPLQEAIAQQKVLSQDQEALLSDLHYKAWDFQNSRGNEPELKDAQEKFKQAVNDIQTQNEQIKKSIQDEENKKVKEASERTGMIQTIVLSAIALMTVTGVLLGLFKKVVFYNDYQDLMLSLGVLVLPFLVAIFTSFLPSLVTGIAVYTSLGVMLIALSMRTYFANQKNILMTLILIIGKLALSFLFFIHLFSAMTSKNKESRRFAAFILVLLSPLMLALVHDKTTGDGSFLKHGIRLWR